MSQEELSIAWLVIIFILLMLFFALGLVSLFMRFQLKKNKLIQDKIDTQNRITQTLLQSRIEVQEATLSTLSKELHDNIGQLLSSAKMLLGITERNMTSPPDTLKTALETVSKAIFELRALSKSFNKEWLEQFNLLENLTAEVTRLNTSNQVTLHLVHSGYLPLPPDEQIILFRILQEAIQNSLRHSSAKNIYISLALDHATLTTTIQDDGQGFAHKNKPEGVGIMNMKQRASMLHGHIEWTTNENGSLVKISVPCKPDSEYSIEK